MRSSIINGTTLGLLLALFAGAVHAQPTQVPACGVELRIRSTESAVRAQGNAVYFHRVLVAEMVNMTDVPVRLVQPGDGSGVGWRTPMLQWEVTTTGGHTGLQPPPRSCGNINPLRPGEVFELLPGDAVRLNAWVPPVHVEPGTYHLRLSYINDPAMTWQGLELAPHDPGEMQRVRETTWCRVASNDIILTVLPEVR
ncbi:MAG TPA: hypothetical protein VMF13_17000 [Luteitalea sp.]|nr:hypothetical protein [Luteitalea sp.]